MTKPMTSTHVTAVLYNEMQSPWDLWIELFPFIFQRSKSTASSSLCALLLKGLCCSLCVHPMKQLSPISPAACDVWGREDPKSWVLWSHLSHCLHMQYWDASQC